MDPNTENTPQWPPPNPNRPASFVPMPEGGSQQPTQPPVQQALQPVQPMAPQPYQPQPYQQELPQQPVYRQQPPQYTMQPMPGAVPPPAPKVQKLNTKPLVIASIAAFAVIILGTAAALFWPKSQPVAQQSKPQTTATYYYADSAQNTSGGTPYTVNMAFANPATGAIAKQGITTTWPLTQDNSLRFSADGSRYAYATSDLSGIADSSKATPEDYKLVTGTWPQQAGKERVLYTETKHNDSREWLLTQDGKELIYLDIATDANKNVTTSDLYSIDVASGKSTRIGAIDRPANRENTPLYEITKDNSVRFYTEQDDGIYQTRYDRKTRTLTNKKVVIRDYDTGHMGIPSPDGTKMLYFGVGANDFTVYLLDLVEGGSTPLISTPAKYGTYDGGYWSPDSKSAALSAVIRDIDGKHYENQMLIIDTVVRTTANNMISRNKSPDTDNSTSSYTITSWSPDGAYLTYVQNNQFYFYDIKNNKVADTLKIAKPTNVNAHILGWTTSSKQAK